MKEVAGMCQAAPPPGGHLEVSQVRLEGAVVASAKHGQGWGFCFLRELTFRFLCPFYLYFIKKANWEQGCTGGHWRVEGVHGTRYCNRMFLFDVAQWILRPNTGGQWYNFENVTYYRKGENVSGRGLRAIL